MLLGLSDLERCMNVGKTLFAQVMEYVPWKTFGRITERWHGNAGVRTLSCADLFRVMAFAQLTWRESLRDIEVYLTANQTKLFHMGIKNIPARLTLADALAQRDWHIYHALAMRLITRARNLYCADTLNIELDATVYALDATPPLLPRALAPHSIQRPRLGQNLGLSDQQHQLATFDHRCLVQEPLAGRAVLQMDQTAPANQTIFGYERKRGQDANLVSAVSTYVLIAIVKKELHLDASLYTLLQILSVSVFEKT
jgi:hypothetical protein